MSELELIAGEGRLEVKLRSHLMGKDRIVYIFNEKEHLGAVAVAEYSHSNQRASVSVIGRSGHRDDEIARSAALAIARKTKRAVCVMVGIHVDHATRPEIEQVVKNVEKLVRQFPAEAQPSSIALPIE